jgi:hypothetical protein
VSRENPNAIESQPIYCYSGQADEIARLHRRLFIMSPLIPVSGPHQIRLHDFPHPVFFFVKSHPRPVPWDEFLPFLTENDATTVEVELGPN